MLIKFSYLLGVCVLLLNGCQYSTFNSFKGNMPANKQAEQREISLSNRDVINDSPKMVVMLGGVSVKDGRLIAEGFVEGEESRGGVKAGMVFDVLNCAGYIGQIRILPQPDDGFEHYWQNVELITDSIQPNYKETIKKCGNKEFPNSSSAFAVYPSKAERVKIKAIGKPDLKALYNSLTPEQKKWRATRNKEREPKFYEMLEDDYVWTDLDGDGKIDLITINGTCSGIPNDELSCIKILYFADGEWKEIARITPA